ncbi:MAG: tmk [Gammaproteobacteria bacterium]|jgi:dTMP kinase|nr:tmk [Gammaproteobacteria bacterium]
MSGIFITFEGIEGVGKSTLQKGLAEALEAQGYSVLLTREPGGTKLGEKLRAAILSKEQGAVAPVAELLIMFAARAQHVEECIKPALAAGKVVLCDRFTDTTRAYQCGGRGLPDAWLEQLIEMTHCGLTPDISFWLDLPVDEALGRAKNRSEADRIEQETKDFFERAREVYRNLASAEPQRVIRLDAASLPQALIQQALEVFRQRV